MFHFSHPRRKARILANALIESLQSETVVWEHSGPRGDYTLMHTTGIVVCAKTGHVFDTGGHAIWMPIFQRFRLRRAARQRAIEMTQNNFANLCH